MEILSYNYIWAFILLSKATYKSVENSHVNVNVPVAQLEENCNMSVYYVYLLYL